MHRKGEILAKLAQIQEQAQLTLDELPMRLAKDRLRLIIGLTRYLTTAVEMGSDEPPTVQPTPHDPKPPLGPSRS